MPSREIKFRLNDIEDLALLELMSIEAPNTSLSINAWLKERLIEKDLSFIMMAQKIKRDKENAARDLNNLTIDFSPEAIIKRRANENDPST